MIRRPPRSTLFPYTTLFRSPRWKTLEPFRFKPEKHTRIYGEPETGRVLSGIAGHSLCLDLFGMPSPEESKFGETIHGEAGVSKWKFSLKTRKDRSEERRVGKEGRSRWSPDH